MAAKKSLNAPIESKWERAVEDVYQQYNCIDLPLFDRPLLINWMAVALKDAYEQGLAKKEYQPPSLRVHTQPERAVVRRTRTPVAVVEVEPVTRVIRRRTKG